MAMLPINVPPGVVRQETPYDTPDRWWDCNLVRWQASNIIPVGGNVQLFGVTAGDVIRRLRVWRDNSSQEWIAAGTDSSLLIYSDTKYVITPTGFTPNTGSGVGGYGALNYGANNYGDARASQPVTFNKVQSWSMDNFGQILLAVASQDGKLYQWTPPSTGTLATVVTNAPTSNAGVAVTGERSVVLIGAGGNPRRVQWSDREDYTSASAWTSTATNIAGYLDVESATPLLACKRVKEGILILSSTDAFLLRYVGAPSYYGVERLGRISFRAPYSLTSVGNFTMWWGQDTFWMYDGGSLKAVPCDLFNDILVDMDPTYAPYRVHMAENGVFPEVWMWYPSLSSTDGECDKYVYWNYAENYWAWGRMRRTAWAAPGGGLYPYAAGPDQYLYQHEYGWLDNGATRVGNVWVESGVLDAMGQGTVKTINRANVGGDPGRALNYSLTFYGRYTPDGPETTFGPYTARTDGYMDTRVTARDIRCRFGLAADGPWAVGATKFDIVVTGGNR
jgi:hypothetical protein